MRDAVATMGTILPDEIKEGTRDAVHVACIAVTAKAVLKPGMPVDRDGDIIGKAVGIADPFVTKRILPGQRFWLYLFPRTITGLNHHWSHPDFPEKTPDEIVIYTEHYQPMRDEKATAEQWLRTWAGSTSDCPGYETLMEILEHNSIDEHTVNSGDLEISADIPDEFWDHYETMTGRRFVRRPSRFSCAC